MGIHAKNGVVFTAATTDWSRVLASGEPHVEKITENVVRRLGSGDAEHPAVKAWNRLCSKRAEPNLIEILLEGKKGNFESRVYRLHGAGPSGTAIIAKRCITNVEQTVYEEILPH